MFMTQDHAEELLSGPFGRERFWHRVELSKDDPWFYVSTGFARIGCKGLRYYLLAEVSELVSFIKGTNENFWIEQVTVVIPPRITGTGRWEMNRLKELVAIADSTDLTVIDYIYQLEDDFCFATTDIALDTCQKRQTLFAEAQHVYSDSSVE